MRIWLVKNAFVNYAPFLKIYGALAQAAQARGMELIEKDNARLWDDLGKNEQQPDFVLFWDKDVRLAWQMEKAGMRLFNSAKSIALCDDKTLTCLALDGTLPMPEWRCAPSTFYEYTDWEFLYRAGEKLHWPLIIKEAKGSFGLQVYLAQNPEEAKEILSKNVGKPMLLQRFVAPSFGRDVRIYVVGDRCAAAMERRGAQGDFRANIGAGGTAHPHQITPEEEEIALKAVHTLGLTFAGVDLLFGQEGMLLCEVNSNAHFTALQALTGVDIPGMILEEAARQSQKE